MQQKRTVLITGGAKGIGLAMARAFADRDFNVAITYLSSSEQAKSLVSELSARNIRCAAYACDVRDFKAVEGVYKACLNTFGFVDTLINNAAVSHYKLFTDESPDDFDRVIDTDLKSVFNLSRVFCGDMISNRFGRIINISSIWGQTGASMEVLYSAAKAGVIGFTKALAAELAPSGVTVNALAPGMIRTDMNASFSETELQAFLQDVPASRMGEAEEVASAACFLASEQSAYINGQVLGINGGFVR